jgi:hypothetical protein
MMECFDAYLKTVADDLHVIAKGWRASDIADHIEAGKSSHLLTMQRTPPPEGIPLRMDK